MGNEQKWGSGGENGGIRRMSTPWNKKVWVFQPSRLLLHYFLGREPKLGVHILCL